MTFSYALKYITFVSVTGMHSKRCSGLIFLSALLFCTFPVESCLHRCTINEDVCKYLRVYFLTGFVIFCKFVLFVEQRLKVVMLEDLAAQFKIKTQVSFCYSS